MPTGSMLWPANKPHNLYAVPSSSITASFEEESERLFVPDDEEDGVDISIIELRPTSSTTPRVNERLLYSTEEVLEYVRESAQREASRGVTTIIQIKQTFSWGQLQISPTAAQTLLTHFDISPGFWPVLKLFGCKESDAHEAAGGFNELMRSEADDSFEISYTAKHAEEHHRPDRAAYDPWSIRQIGVNHSYDAKRDANTFVLVNSSNALMERIRGLSPDAEALQIHRLIYCAVTERWGQYLAHLESVCKDISKKAVLAKSLKKVVTRGFEVHFSDSQRIRDLQDTIIHVSHMLDLNLSISENLLASTDLFLHMNPNVGCGGKGRSTQSSILTLSARTKLWKCHAESLLRQLDGSSVLVSSILDAKALETLQVSSGTTAELAALARHDALKAKKEARTLNTITLLGFVYLPASFVATLLGTQYINIRDNEGGHISITFAREMWIFAILTFILLIVTVGTWRLWEWRNRKADRGAVDDLGKAV